MCRRPHGASFVTWCGVPPERMRITTGEHDLVNFKSSERGSRNFCRHCGSPLFCQSDPKFVSITLATLHGKIDREPEAHVFYDSRAEWTEVNDDLPKYAQGGTDPAKT
jgi:hypothetical protein